MGLRFGIHANAWQLLIFHPASLPPSDCKLLSPVSLLAENFGETESHLCDQWEADSCEVYLDRFLVMLKRSPNLCASVFFLVCKMGIVIVSFIGLLLGLNYPCQLISILPGTEKIIKYSYFLSLSPSFPTATIH